MPEYSFINFDIRQGVACITLNRPDVLNSFNRAMAAELRQSLETCRANSDIRSVLLTGAGRAFCAGQDLAEVAPSSTGTMPVLGDIVLECYNPIIIAIRRLEKPVVCAVNGVAAGAGANLALACDIVIASSTASFIQSFSKVGLIPDSGGTFFLPRLIGLARASALVMLGDKLSAADAVSIGLIYRTCEPEKLKDEASGIATYLATQPTRGFGLTKRGLNASLDNGLEAQLNFEAELQSEAGRTQDYAEGVKSFLEKRKPVFKGT